ncbi:hypothetical protein MKC69_14215 [[Clostridium] innocuum]|uniref:hypothetical protein n=1 Tax=Clostridium innocuum TaxID=1522 RepID=UPI001E547D30|nr:hypothetical protein [[Clostridium] innocuum]MCC2836288.1 hypothetical protein [[Clostridium] innocuum]MCI3000276.1 hypothetical protein [[Clostridium] innocuum]MCR0179104.1 hypothetical protein [[Clostridium] innocuum]MCR0210653.1 hypothetical protein [[Clostridium] innocuum]MCR0241291.1 hypothetical protein [[Clostridium] innocuum]
MDLRDYAKSKGVKLWQIAEKLNINDGNFSRKLRKELPDQEKKKIIMIVDEVANSESGEAV